MPGAVVLLMGRSFSGKSTVSHALSDALTARVLSYDAINAERGLHGGQGVPVEEWLRTNEIAHARAADLLAAGATVVVDDTSSPRFLRDQWRRRASDSLAGFVLVFVDASPETIQARLLANRRDSSRGDVIDSVMDDHLDGFKPPQPDEPHLRSDETTSSSAIIRAVRAALGC